MQESGQDEQRRVERNPILLKKAYVKFLREKSWANLEGLVYAGITEEEFDNTNHGLNVDFNEELHQAQDEVVRYQKQHYGVTLRHGYGQLGGLYMILYESFVETIIETLAHAPWLFRYMTTSMVLKIEVFTTKDAAKPYLTDEILDEIIVHKVRGNRYKDIRQDSHAFSIFVRDLYQMARSTYRHPLFQQKDFSLWEGRMLRSVDYMSYYLDEEDLINSGMYLYLGEKDLLKMRALKNDPRTPDEIKRLIENVERYLNYEYELRSVYLSHKGLQPPISEPYSPFSKRKTKTEMFEDWYLPYEQKFLKGKVI